MIDARLQKCVEGVSHRIVLAQVSLGLYVVVTRLMLQAVGPRPGGMPSLAPAGYALANQFIFSIARWRAWR